MDDRGWFKAIRSDKALDIILTYQPAFVLLYIIASRARWSSEPSVNGLTQGQAFLGDFRRYGMTEKQYRTAKQKLEKWHFAAFKGANKGTTATLLDRSIFDIYPPEKGEQKGGQRADKGRTEGDKSTRIERNTDKNLTGQDSVLPNGVCSPNPFRKFERSPKSREEVEAFFESLPANGYPDAETCVNRFIDMNNKKRWQLTDWRKAAVKFWERMAVSG
jgi:hypothetical protein